MFRVKFKNGKQTYPVLSVRYDEDRKVTFFLIYDKRYGGWCWWNADEFIPEVQ